MKNASSAAVEHINTTDNNINLANSAAENLAAKMNGNATYLNAR
jgi:hypothetical protein